MGLLLLIVAIFLFCLLGFFGLLYLIIKTIINILFLKINILYTLSYLNDFFLVLAISIDQLGNVVCKDLFNDTLIKKDCPHKFGNPDETVSRVLGLAKRSGHLTKIGKFFANALNKIDKNHVENASK
jgi:hypothetical protein